jgi:hypothetical protein
MDLCKCVYIWANMEGSQVLGVEDMELPRFRGDFEKLIIEFNKFLSNVSR